MAGTYPSLTKRGTLVPLDYERITGLSSVQSLTVPEGATIAFIQAETQGVRWRDDGDDPDSTNGTPIVAGAALEYDGDLSEIKFIELTASAVLHVTYYR